MIEAGNNAGDAKNPVALLNLQVPYFIDGTVPKGALGPQLNVFRHNLNHQTALPSMDVYLPRHKLQLFG